MTLIKSHSKKLFLQHNENQQIVSFISREKQIYFFHSIKICTFAKLNQK